MIDEVEQEIVAFLQEKHPEYGEKYDLLLMPKDAPNLNSSNIANLVQSIYLTFLRNQYNSCTMLYILVSNFAEAYGEHKEIEFLDKVWEGREINSIPIPNLEAILLRDMSTPGFRVSQKYSDIFGSNTGTIYTLGELNVLLNFAKKRIFRVFLKIYIRHDVKVQVQFPNFADSNDKSVMEKL